MNTKLTRKLFLGLSILTISLLQGCATFKDPAISDDITAMDLSNESVGVFTLKVANDHHPSYQLDAKYAFIWKEGDDDERYSVEVLDPYKEDDSFYEYLISFQLTPGNYVLREIFAQSGIFPVRGSFALPLYKTVALPKNQVVYLGHIDATVVEKTTDDEIAAGPIIPLIDQAVTGASTGTFKVKFEDRFDTDIQYIKERYPYMTNVQFNNQSFESNPAGTVAAE